MYEYSEFWPYSLTKYLKCAYKEAKIPQTTQKPNLFCSSSEIVYTLEKFKLSQSTLNKKTIHFINSNSACVACGNSQRELFCLVILHNEDLSYIWVVNLAQTCLVFMQKPTVRIPLSTHAPPKRRKKS